MCNGTTCKLQLCSVNVCEHAHEKDVTLTAATLPRFPEDQNVPEKAGLVQGAGGEVGPCERRGQHL